MTEQVLTRQIILVLEVGKGMLRTAGGAEAEVVEELKKGLSDGAGRMELHELMLAGGTPLVRLWTLFWKSSEISGV